MDEELNADIGEERGYNGDCELDGEFEEGSEALFVIPNAQRKENYDAEDDDEQFGDFFEEAGGVDGDGGAEEIEPAGGDEESYYQYGGEEEGGDGGKYGDAAAEGDGRAVVTINCRAGDKIRSKGVRSDYGGENGRDRKGADEKNDS